MQATFGGAVGQSPLVSNNEDTPILMSGRFIILTNLYYSKEYNIYVMYRFFRTNSHKIIAMLVALTGSFSLVLKPLLLHDKFRIEHLSFELIHDTRAMVIALSGVLLYLAFQLWNRKRRALIITALSLLSLISLSIIHHHFIHLVAYMLLLMLLVYNRQLFFVKSSNLNLRHGIGSALTVIIITLIYGIIGFTLLDKHEIGTSFNLNESVALTVNQMTFQSVQPSFISSGQPKILVDSIQMLSITALILAITSLFKPLQFISIYSQKDYKLAKKIITEAPESPEDYFKLYPRNNKHYFFSEDNKSVIAYTVTKGVALVIDGPSGDNKSNEVVLSQFTKFISTQDWVPSIIHANQNINNLVNKIGYKTIYIGSEALVDCGRFTNITQKSKHFRYVKNRAIREGLSIEHWVAPLSNSQIRRLKFVSDEWISSGKQEYTFIMSPFSESYLKNCNVSVLIKDNKPIAYANALPKLIDDQLSIDHMRHVKSLPPTGMHFLLMQMIVDANANGIKKFNLGLAPLSKLNTQDGGGVSERLLQTIKKLGSKFYSFRGLEQFKNKFEPDWEPRYICYKGNVANLAKVLNSLNNVIRVETPSGLRTRKLILVGISLLAAMSYASFPIGYLLKLNNHSVVSQLGASGAPYSTLFNALDVVSGVLLISLYVVGRRVIQSRKSLICLRLLAVAGAGGILAALITLPSKHSGGNVLADLLHILFSAVNTGAILLATLMYASVPKKFKRLWGYLNITLLTSLAVALVFNDNIIGAVSQRVQISLVSAAIVLMTLLAINNPTSKD